MLWWKSWQTPLVKKYTLVKENTPCCHKIRQECGFTQKTSFFSELLCFLPHCHANIGRQVRFIPPNTYQEIYDTHTCLNLWKTCQNVCVMQDMLKSRCKFVTLLGKYASKNKLAGRSFFQNLGSQGSGRVSPGGSSRAAPSTFFAACSEASWSGGFNCVSKVLLKASVKNMAFGRRKSNHTLARCAFFYQHCFTKTIENI